MTEILSSSTPVHLKNTASGKLLVAALIIVLVVGALMRIVPTASRDPINKNIPAALPITYLGFDEDCYRHYLMMIDAKGLIGYPAVARSYVAAQPDLPFAVIPPTRVTFIATAYLWQIVSKSGPVPALRAVSCLFTVLGLVGASVFAWRIAGLPTALAITALMSCAPLQIQMAQRPYIDGIFACWALFALWMLWENLRAPNRHGLLTGYALSLALMVMTKENAAFVFVAILGIIALNRWIQFGRVTPRLLIATFIGPLLGVLVLLLAAGGINTLIEIYRLNVEKSFVLPYAIKTGDGPWFRYALDLLIMNPAVTLLAIAGFFNIQRRDKPGVYFALFIAITYLIMANVGCMNLRYGSIWDMPLRWLAFGQLTVIAGAMRPRFARYFIPLAVILLSLLDLNQYFLFFAQNGLYDPLPDSMLRILNIVK